MSTNVCMCLVCGGAGTADGSYGIFDKFGRPVDCEWCHGQGVRLAPTICDHQVPQGAQGCHLCHGRGYANFHKVRTRCNCVATIRQTSITSLDVPAAVGCELCRKAKKTQTLAGKHEGSIQVCLECIDVIKRALDLQRDDAGTYWVHEEQEDDDIIDATEVHGSESSNHDGIRRALPAALIQSTNGDNHGNAQEVIDLEEVKDQEGIEEKGTDPQD